VASGQYDHGPVGKPTGPLAAPRLVVEAQVEAGVSNFNIATLKGVVAVAVEPSTGLPKGVRKEQLGIKASAWDFGRHKLTGGFVEPAFNCRF